MMKKELRRITALMLLICLGILLISCASQKPSTEVPEVIPPTAESDSTPSAPEEEEAEEERIPENQTVIYRAIAEDMSIDYLTAEDRAEIMDFVEKKKKGGHGCFLETAWLYHYAPETVKLDKVAAESGESTGRFDAFAKANIKTHFAWMGNYPNSYTASTDYVMNERIARAVTEYCEARLVEKLTFLKNETISDTLHEEWLAKQ